MNHQIIEVTEQGFQAQVLDSALPVLIEFTAEWCPPCKMLIPIMNELASKYESVLQVGMINTDIEQTIVQRYMVMGMPTLMLFINGEPVERIVGFTPLARIESKILPHLNRENA